MSATRDPDRILRAWLDQMPSEAPDRAIDAVLLATTAAPQVRAWPWLGRWRPNHMNRLSLVAATAALLVALVGGAMLLTGGKSGPTPTASPSPSLAPTPPVTPNPTPPTSPIELQSSWVANNPPGSAAAVLTLEILPNLITVRDAGSDTVLARAESGSEGDFAFVAPDSNHGCNAGDAGHYRYLFGQRAGDAAAGDIHLTFSATSDACPLRQQILERTWTRVFSNGFKGGRAVGIDFDPMFMVTLPGGLYEVTVAGKDALMVESPIGAAPGIFVATRNPSGFAEPCSETGGAKIPVAHTVDAFMAYIGSLPGFSVERADVEFGGLPAVHLSIASTVTADCPRADHRVIEWSTSDPTFSWHIVLGQGDPDSIYLFKPTADDLYLFQWLTPTLDPTAEAAVLDTIEFFESIPN